MKFDKLIEILLNRSNLLSQYYKECYSKLEIYGFTSADIIKIAINNVTPPAAKKNVDALINLVLPSSDKTNIPTYNCLPQLSSLKISLKEVINILSHEDGAQNLNTLLDLLSTFHDENVTPISSLMKLNREGFPTQYILNLLSQPDGYVKVKLIQSILTPIMDANTQPWSDNHGTQITTLKLILEAGFTLDQVLDILNFPEGMTNFNALVSLLLSYPDANNQPCFDKSGKMLSKVRVLLNEGFTAFQLFNTLNRYDGAQNIGVLEASLSPILDEENKPKLDEEGIIIPQIRKITQAGISPVQIIGVLNQGNLEFLKWLVSTRIDANNTFPVTLLDLLVHQGFSKKELVSLLNQRQGCEILTALLTLVRPSPTTSAQSSSESIPVPQFCQLVEKGFTAQQILNVLNNRNTKKNLIALQLLLSPLANNDSISQLDWLLSHQITVTQIVQVLNHRAALKNLQCLISLCSFFGPAPNQLYIDNQGIPFTPFKLLIEAGFTIGEIIGVLDQENGLLHMGALQKMVFPVKNALNQIILDQEGVAITPLKQFAQAGITKEHIINVVQHVNGDKNLRALQTLITPLKNAINQIMLDEAGLPLTRLKMIQQKGFTTEQITDILNLDSGFQNLEAMIQLLNNEKSFEFLKADPGRIKCLVELACTKSKSAHITFLRSLLESKENCQYIEEHTAFATLCYNLKRMNKKDITSLNSQTVLIEKLCTSSLKRIAEPALPPEATKKNRVVSEKHAQSPDGFFYEKVQVTSREKTYQPINTNPIQFN